MSQICMTHKHADLIADLLSIGRDAKVTTERHFLPVGELMHDAAKAIEEMEERNQEQEKRITQLEELLTECFPIR